MQGAMETSVALNLSCYLEASREKYKACLDSIDHDLSITGVAAQLRFHHVRFNGNGEPKFGDLAQCLADHIIEYCFSARRRGRPQQPHEWARLAREARAILRKHPTGGESGELLIYFLLETILGAPQMVAKMDVKGNPNFEVLGSDGIHMRWNQEESCLDMYFGEAKLEDDVYGALDNAFKSIENFHADGLLSHEFGLVTSHFKWADDDLREAVRRYIDRQDPIGECRVHHACLIGFDWKEYQNLKSTGFAELTAEFRDKYSQRAPELRDLLQKRFDKCARTQFRFEVFFLPFCSVQEFRDAFNEAIK